MVAARDSRRLTLIFQRLPHIFLQGFRVILAVAALIRHLRLRRIELANPRQMSLLKLSVSINLWFHL